MMFDLLFWLICRFLDPWNLLISWLESQLVSPKLQSPKVLISIFLNFLKIFVIRFLGRPCLIFEYFYNSWRDDEKQLVYLWPVDLEYEK